MNRKVYKLRIIFCKTIKIYFFLMGIILSGSFSNEHDINAQQNSSLKLTIIEENNLRILSWNIKMMPAPYSWFHNSVNRAENIVLALKNSEPYDVILFQEVFSKKIRKMIFDELQSIYPYQINPINHINFFKTNSGLWVISQNPITLIDEISFTQVRGWDKLSSKGAKLYSIIKNRQEFYLINTHLQSDYKKKYSTVRINQYTEINENLILPYVKHEIPIILCGDLNISKASHMASLLNKLKLKNGLLSGKLQFSTVGQYNELLDYILVKTETFKFQSVERKIQNMSVNLFINPIQLSDHYPIEGIFKW